jgi:hypothetical protein
VGARGDMAGDFLEMELDASKNLAPSVIF